MSYIWIRKSSRVPGWEIKRYIGQNGDGRWGRASCPGAGHYKIWRGSGSRPSNPKIWIRGRLQILEDFRKIENQDLRNNMGAAAHMIHGSSDSRFTIVYAVKKISQEEIRNVGYIPADYEEVCKRYDPEKLSYGWNQINGEEIFFIPNPALGLWVNREKFG